MKKAITLWKVLMVAFTMVLVAPGSEVDAATEYQVPTTVTTYYSADDADSSNPPALKDVKWERVDNDTFKYNAKGDLIKKNKVNFKWKYKKSKKAKVSSGNKKLKFRAVIKYKKGKIASTSSKHYKKGKVVAKVSGKYKTKKGWIKSFSGKMGNNKYTETFTWKLHGNKMPKNLKIKVKVGRGTYQYKYYFNDKGLMTKNFMSDETYTYTTDSSGRVVERIGWFGDIPISKTVYSYTGATTKNKKVYIGVMNNEGQLDDWLRDAIPFEYGMIAK